MAAINTADVDAYNESLCVDLVACLGVVAVP
jgi:hypothetical protein